MGTCQYRFNATEIYRRTPPGTAPETTCGARTYPAVDEPELAPVSYPDGRVEYRKTGRLIPRGQHDPHCPVHGGSPEPEPPPVTMAELENAHDAYMQLAARFEGAIPVILPAPDQVPAALTNGETEDAK